jgi:RNA polymerase sigma-70 factor (ECF subfamily)
LETDQTLVEALLNPKTQNEAYRKLIHTYQKPLYFHIRSIVLNHDDTDDVLQNTFVKIFRHLKDFKHESKLYTWMYRIATNESLTFIAQRAKKNQTTSLEIQEKAVANLQSDVYFEGQEIELKLQNALATLPEKQALVFKMKYFQELKYEELSEILETSVGALKASYHHAVKKIENYLENH